MPTPSVTTYPIMTGNMYVGGTVNATVAVFNDSGDPPLVLDGVRWTIYRYLDPGTTEQYDIPGATSQSLVIPYLAVGYRIQFIASAHNPSGNSDAFAWWLSNPGPEDSPIVELQANVPPVMRSPRRSRRTSW